VKYANIGITENKIKLMSGGAGEVLWFVKTINVIFCVRFNL